MQDFFKKIIFLFKKNPVVVVAGRGEIVLEKIASRVIKNEDGTLVFAVDFTGDKEIKDLKSFLKKSKKPILAVAPITGETEQEPTKEKAVLMDRISDFIKFLPDYGFVVASFDDGIIRRIKSEASSHILTYGLRQGADLLASDINIGPAETNFKANYEGYTVPFWIKNLTQKNELYLILAVIGIGIAQGFNLVWISQFLKSFDFTKN